MPNQAGLPEQPTPEQPYTPEPLPPQGKNKNKKNKVKGSPPPPWWNGYPAGQAYPGWGVPPQGMPPPPPYWHPYYAPIPPGYAPPPPGHGATNGYGQTASPGPAPQDAPAPDKDFIGDFLKSPIPSLTALLGMNDPEFWKGALLGAAAMILLSNHLGQDDE